MKNGFRPTGPAKPFFGSVAAFGGTGFVFDDVRPLGFLGNPNAHDAEYLIGQTEQLVMVLDPTEKNLTPALEALNAAKALYAAQDYAKAVAQAARAATLAVSLNEQFTSYLAMWKELQSCREELQEIGFPTDGLEAALAVADREVAHPITDGGAVVPNYQGATQALAKAMDEARTLVRQAREASREIFLATLAVEALSDSPAKQAPSWITLRLEQMVEQASRELAEGHLPAAELVASEAKARAEDALAGAARAWERLDLVAAILDGLGAEGPAAAGLAARIDAAKDALARGIPDRASAHVIVRQLSDEVAAFARRYPPSRKLLGEAEGVYEDLRKEGVTIPEVDAALAEARVALGNGAWAPVREKVASLARTFLQLRKEQETLSRAVAEIDERVALLQAFRLPLLPEVQEILARAREAVRSGRISAAHEDVALAGTLMAQATRTGS